MPGRSVPETVTRIFFKGFPRFFGFFEGHFFQQSQGIFQGGVEGEDGGQIDQDRAEHGHGNAPGMVVGDEQGNGDHLADGFPTAKVTHLNGQALVLAKGAGR